MWEYPATFQNIRKEQREDLLSDTKFLDHLKKAVFDKLIKL